MPPLVADAHHHIWRQADLAWLQGPPQPRIFGEYAALCRDYSIEEYMADARAAGVVRSVYVQTNWPAGREEEEVAWVQAVADRHGFPHAIVGYADLAAPTVGAALDRMMKHARLRGIRQQLHWHEQPLYRFAARPDLMDDPAWRSGLVEVARRGGGMCGGGIAPVEERDAGFTKRSLAEIRIITDRSLLALESNTLHCF